MAPHPRRPEVATPKWIQDVAGDAARWLDLVPFEAIPDERNAQPIRRNVKRVEAQPYAGHGWVEPSTGRTLDPYVGLWTPEEGEAFAIQPYRLAVFGEKTSLASTLGPIAASYGASLYLPTGESSDTMAYWLMRDAAEDGRPLRVFYVSDCDPSGWQMSISLARTVQALRDMLFADVPEPELYSVALTPEQVNEYQLPENPIKATDKRAEQWKAAFGIEGTEIDSLLVRKPGVLDGLLTDALDGFYDHTLDRRVKEAEDAWQREADQALIDHIGADALQQMRTDAEERLSQVDDLIAEVNDILTVNVDDVELPPFVVPEPEAERGTPLPAILSREWDWAEQTKRLKARKAYES